MWYKVIGNIQSYRLYAKSRYDAWWCAMKELKYGFTKNTIINTIEEV